MKLVIFKAPRHYDGDQTCKYMRFYVPQRVITRDNRIEEVVGNNYT